MKNSNTTLIVAVDDYSKLPNSVNYCFVAMTPEQAILDYKEMTGEEPKEVYWIGKNSDKRRSAVYLSVPEHILSNIRSIHSQSNGKRSAGCCSSSISNIVF